MGIPINISDLINRKVVENARVEYKSDWNPEPILHSICAFANDIDNWGGGYIIIGSGEEMGMPKFPVKGIEKSSIDRIGKEILQKCSLIEPRYIPVVEQTTFEGKEILVLWAPGARKTQRTRRSQAEIKSLILANLKEKGNLSSSELAAAMGYAKITASVSKAIGDLMEEGQVVYLEPEKVRSRNQKICLRKQGGKR